MNAARPEVRVLADRYRMGAVLGEGGMGQVREAVDLRLDRPVAVKLLRADLASQAELRTRFEREALAAARISHPHVVAVFDTGEDDEIPFIVMERLPGTTLADELARGPLEPERAGSLIAEVVAALDAAHRLGVVHRDIKPGNILLASDGHAKVADFGIATVADTADLTTTGFLVGTTAYLAPERLAGEPATPSSDLYSAGVVLFEALAGQPPFRADTPLGLVAAISNADTPPLVSLRPGVPPTLVAVVERSMARDPQNRFASATAMLAALRTAHGHREPVDAPPTVPQGLVRPAPVQVADTEVAPVAVARPPATSRPTLRRHIGVWVATAVVIAFVVTLVGFALARDRGADGPSTATTPTTTAPVSTAAIPEPLDRAIDRLDRAVSP